MQKVLKLLQPVWGVSFEDAKKAIEAVKSNKREEVEKIIEGFKEDLKKSKEQKFSSSLLKDAIEAELEAKIAVLRAFLGDKKEKEYWQKAAKAYENLESDLRLLASSCGSSVSAAVIRFKKELEFNAGCAKKLSDLARSQVGRSD